MYYSEFTLATTGHGLEGFTLGALEGLSYLVVVGLVATSVYVKSTTGTGLPAGPAGLLGAAEGLSFLAIVGGIAAYIASLSL